MMELFHKKGLNSEPKIKFLLDPIILVLLSLT